MSRSAAVGVVSKLASRRSARPIQGSGRMALTQSAKDGMKPRSSRTCCSPIHLTGMTRPVESVMVGTEDRLRHEDALGMVPQGPVPEIGDDLFRLVKPVMDALVVGDGAAPFPDAGKRMMIRMCHVRLPSKRMAAGRDIGETAIELELNGSGGNVEPEFAVSAVIVFSAAVALLKKVVAEGFNRLVERGFSGNGFVIPILNLLDGDVRCG